MIRSTWSMQIDLCYSMRSEVYIVNSVGTCGSHSYPITAESPPHVKPAAVKIDLPILFYLTDLFCRPVLDRRQLFGERSRTRLIATGRHLHVQSLMRPDMIVAVAPLVKSVLH